MVFHNPMLIQGPSGPAWFDLLNGCLFEPNGDYIRRQNGAGGNRQKFIIGGWLKRHKLASRQYLFYSSSTTGAAPAGNDTSFGVYFWTDNRLRIAGGSTNWRFTEELFVDPTAWTHWLLAIDSTQGVANDRLRLFLNFEEVTSWQTNNAIPLNQNFPVNNNAYYQGFGSGADNWNSFGGVYMAQCFIQDGQDFGAIADYSAGDRSPKDLSGLALGSQGGLYEFGNGADLGEATAGNDMTAFGAPVQVVDTPSNNLPIFSPIEPAITGTVSGGGLTVTGATNQKGTHPIITGRHAWRFTASAAGNVGVINDLGTITQVAVAASDAIEFELDATAAGAAELWYRLNGGARTVAGLLLTGPFAPYFAAAGTADFKTAPTDGSYRIISGATLADVTPAAGSFLGNASANGPVVSLGYSPQTLTIEGSGVIFGGQDADRLASGAKLRTARSPINNATAIKNFSVPTKRRAFGNTALTVPLAWPSVADAVAGDFERSDPDMMTRTFLVATEQNKWTFAAWIKLESTGVQHSLLVRGNDANNESRVFITSTNRLAVFDFRGGAYGSRVSALTQLVAGTWYHIQVAYDPSQAIGSDRIKLLLDNVIVTSFEFSTYPALDYTGGLINTNEVHRLGRAMNIGSDHALDGIMFDAHFVDGQRLLADTFAQDVAGKILPKAYAGGYGNNGWNLTFMNKQDLGEDTSGEGHDWTNSGAVSSGDRPS